MDSLFLSIAWTLVVLQVTAEHGLMAAGVCSTALLVSAASAPTLLSVALAAQLHGRSSVAHSAVAFTLGPSRHRCSRRGSRAVTPTVR